MKKYLIIISAILIITSCEIVEGPFKNDITTLDTISNTYLKNILIEDFTGHLCPNCPEAARELDIIHDIYGDQVIGMAIHVSNTFARPYPVSQAPSFQYDFRTNWGDNWDAFFEISNAGLPRGMINRIGFENGAHKLGKDEWAEVVANELNKEPDFSINITQSANSISIKSNVLNNLSGDYNLFVCLVESNIINWQKDGQNNEENYIHNHVLRTVIIDEELSSSLIYISGQEIDKQISYDLNSLEEFNVNYSSNTAELGNGNAGNWNASNMSVIAYIYNTVSKEISQVEKAYLNN
jgi:hypothetical protein